KPRIVIYSHSEYEAGESYDSRANCLYNGGAPRASRLLVADNLREDRAGNVQHFSACKYDNFDCDVHAERGQGDSERQRLVAAALNTLAVQSGWLAGTSIQPCWKCHPLMAASIHNADCSWSLRGSNPLQAVFIKFDRVQLEGSYHSPCVLDNLTVSYQLRGGSSSASGGCSASSEGPSSWSANGSSATLELRTDSSVGTGFRVTWFAADFSELIPGQFQTSREFIDEQCPEKVAMPDGGGIRLYYDPPQSYETWHVPGSLDCSVPLSTEEAESPKRFCANSDVQLGEKVVTAVGSVQIQFRVASQNKGHAQRLHRGFELFL
uniref:CUB domain-containing protein n=1 Tax=Macrostomum lignano TaxID=282301 RepID=A0A1I8FMF4_9PLAT